MTDATPNGDRDDAAGESRVGRVLERVPRWVVPLGAGFLLASTIVALVGTAYGWYSVLTGRTYGFPAYGLVLLSLEFTFVTVIQAVATRWARQGVRWTWVMVIAFLGLFLFVTIPFNVAAIILLGLGNRHFTARTPADEIAALSTDTDGEG